MSGLAGKTVLLTGAAGGIGEAIARGFAREGARLALVDFDAARGLALRDALRAEGAEAHFAQADVSTYAACEQAHGELTAALGGIDILVNNVGISPKTQGRALRVWEMPPAEWDQVVAVNLNSAFYMARLCSPHMVAQRFGRVVNMSSVAGKAYCDIVAAHYAATKSALLGLTRHWAAELGEFDVTVNGLAPGRISTPLLKSVPQEINDAVARVTALRRLGTPEEVADACLFFASDEARFVTGQVLDVAGGWLMT
ncbi:SDR family oxidoreductase [Bordetella genomosp. 1]|uniref:3-oxoacyl-[acyl-carrier-protein] reductase n=1 Tax=Bordetella genomosp. 1 TaxID=1395607 RepID=A0ABX4F7R4_9BORD|nr:SDR family NAD(P)-dependent oxidoreductase [Bordetella genomosp. 1]OZI69196.1 3-oxoacyl-[acyl-carrier-protein] reductase [Bordetella genomosp. 1]